MVSGPRSAHVPPGRPLRDAASQSQAECVLRFSGGALCVPGYLADRADRAWFDPQVSHGMPVGEGGRQAAWFVCGPFGQAVLRHYRRGGLRARLGRASYFWLGESRSRSFAEFRVLASLRSAGLAVPEPLGAIYWRQGLHYRAAILVARIAGAQTLAARLRAPLAAARGHTPGPVSAAVDPVPVASAIRAMHEAGIYHADLNVHNILLDPDDRVWLIDFDRAIRGVVSPGQSRKNLLRLKRSLVKVCGAQGERWWAQLSSAYDQLPA